ncbi:MAG: hypothetical protein ABIH42_02150 [Planctomycetota bacterium]
MKSKMVLKIIGWVLLGVCVAALLGLLLGFVVKELWNWLMPVVFGLPVITYWQAVGIFILCHILFGGHFEHHRSNNKKDKHINNARSNIKQLIENGDKKPA